MEVEKEKHRPNLIETEKHNLVYLIKDEAETKYKEFKKSNGEASVILYIGDFRPLANKASDNGELELMLPSEMFMTVEYSVVFLSILRVFDLDRSSSDFEGGGGISFKADYMDVCPRLMEKIKDKILSTNKPEKIFKMPEPRTKYLRNFIDIHPGVRHPVLQNSIELTSEYGSLLMVTIDRYIVRYDEHISAAETWTGIRIDYLGKHSGGKHSKTSKIQPHSMVHTQSLPALPSGK